MVAYSFKRQFVEPIRLGTKRQTIRAHRRGRGRHAYPGEALQLYFGMRTKHCEKIIADPICTDVEPIVIDVRTEGEPLLFADGRRVSSEKALREIARADGFNSFGEMALFWIDNHGRVLFEGVRIQWEPEKKQSLR